MDIPTTAQIIGSFFTASSVLFSLYLYWRKKDAEYFNNLRASLIEIQANMAILRESIYNRVWKDIGINVAKEVRAIDPSMASKEEFVELLRSLDKRKYVVTAIALGVRNSKALEYTLSIIERLRRIPFRLESQMPLVTDALRLCLDATGLAAESPFSSEFLGSYLLGNVDELIVKRIVEVKNLDMAEREFAEVFNETCRTGIRDKIQGRIYMKGETVIWILMETLLRKTDRELRRIRKHTRHIARPPEYLGMPEELPLLREIKLAVAQLDCIKDEFDKKDWAEIEKVRNWRVVVSD